MPDSLIQYAAHHPWIFYGSVFGISLAESIAVLGLLVPGAMLMFCLGVIVASSGLSLPLAIHAAALGALIGDFGSFLAGRVWGTDLLERRPFRRWSAAFERARAFFGKHGGKSIFLGRFIGALRPLAPLVAGLLKMPVGRFLLAAVPAAWLWAAAYLLPGVVFGASLALAGRVSARLTVLLLVVVITGWLIAVGVQKMFGAAVRLAGNVLQRCRTQAAVLPADATPGSRGSNGGWMCRLVRFLDHPHAVERLLLPLLAVVAATAGAGFLALLQAALAETAVRRADHAVYTALQFLRNSPADHVMVTLTELGDGVVNFAVTAAIALALIVLRRKRAAAYWITTILGGSLLVLVVKSALQMPRPPGASETSFGFPSGHAAMSLTIYGFLGFLTGVPAGSKRMPYLGAALAGAFCFLIAFSRLYLGVHWLSDVLGGWLLSAGWMSVLGICYLVLAPHHTLEALPRRPLAAVLFGTLAVAGGMHATAVHRRDLRRYQPHRFVRTFEPSAWIAGGWRVLPPARIDLGGDLEAPLTIQWCGPVTTLRERLESRGWRDTPPVTLASLLQTLAPAPAVEELPVLPRLHDGRPEVLRMMHPLESGRTVLRLWPSDARLTTGHRIYIGTVERQIGRQYAGWFTFPRNAGNPAAALDMIQRDLADFVLRKVTRPMPDGDASTPVLLTAPPAVLRP